MCSHEKFRLVESRLYPAQHKAELKLCEHDIEILALTEAYWF